MSRIAIKMIPSAGRLIGSLRDLGYEFPQAVADLVDNSVTADATRVEIDLCFDGEDSWLRIADNGQGMSSTEITEAMRYGAHQAYEDEDLGRFGLGLKTASLSQCRRLTVASRVNDRIEIRQLDLDHVLQSNRWEIFSMPRREADVLATDPLKDGPGTVILWQGLDRILAYKDPGGGRARNACDALVSDLSAHLGMIFHRFMTNEISGRPALTIKINNRRIEAWDPFARSEAATRVLPAEDFDIVAGGTVGLVRYQPYVLPSRDRFSSEDSFNRYAGPRRWNAQQGFYIYRANRLVQAGGWCRMRAPDEHLKLARAAIDFFPDLDHVFEINVAKVRVSIPADLRQQLQRPIESLVRAAQAAYRSHSDSEPLTRRRGEKVSVALCEALESAASAVGERTALRKIVRELKRSEPSLATKLGW